METISLVVSVVCFVLAGVMLARARLLMTSDYLVVFSVSGKIWTPWAGYRTKKKADKACSRLNEQTEVKYKVISSADSVVFTLDEIEKRVYICDTDAEAAVLKKSIAYQFEVLPLDYKGINEVMLFSVYGWTDEGNKFPDLTP